MNLQNRDRKGRYTKGARECTVGAANYPSTKGLPFGLGSYVENENYSQNNTPDAGGNIKGRGITTRQGGLPSRADTFRTETAKNPITGKYEGGGGITIREALRQAGD